MAPLGHHTRALNLFIFAGKLINLRLSGPTVCWALSLVLCAKQGQKYHCSDQRKTLYLWMEIDFYSSDSWLLKDKPLRIILLCFLNSFFEESFISN